MRLCGRCTEYGLGVGVDRVRDGGRQLVPLHHQGSLGRGGRRLANGVAADRRAGRRNDRPQRSLTLDGEHLILQSDHGSQYTSAAHWDCLESCNLTISTGRVRTYADNASAEHFVSKLNRELVCYSHFRAR